MLKLALVCVVIFAGFNVAASVNTTAATNTTTQEEPMRDPCIRCERFRCCGKYYVCAKNCTGQPCDEDSQCGGGCCTSGNCTAESCSTPFELTPVQVGLVAGGSALALSLACTCTCKCVRSRRRRNKKQPNVVVNMHVPPTHGDPPPNRQPQMPMGAHHPKNPPPNPQPQMPMGAYHPNIPPPNPPPGVNYGYQGSYYQAR